LSRGLDCAWLLGDDARLIFMAYRYVYCRFCGAKLAGLGSEMESGRCLHCLASSGLRLLPSERQRLREETADWDPQRVARRCRRCHALLSLYNLDNYCEACLTKIREEGIHRGAKSP
jgi:ribosomal protein L40E